MITCHPFLFLGSLGDFENDQLRVHLGLAGQGQFSRAGGAVAEAGPTRIHVNLVSVSAKVRKAPSKQCSGDVFFGIATVIFHSPAWVFDLDAFLENNVCFRGKAAKLF